MQTALSTAVDWWALFAGIVDLVFKLAIIPIAIAAVLYLAKLTGFKLSEQQTADLKSSIETGLLAAESKGLASLKSHGEALPGPEKLGIALTVAREVSKDGLKAQSDDELKVIAEAALVKLKPLISTPPPAKSISVAPMSWSIAPPSLTPPPSP